MLRLLCLPERAAVCLASQFDERKTSRRLESWGSHRECRERALAQLGNLAPHASHQPPCSATFHADHLEGQRLNATVHETMPTRPSNCMWTNLGSNISTADIPTKGSEMPNTVEPPLSLWQISFQTTAITQRNILRIHPDHPRMLNAIPAYQPRSEAISTCASTTDAWGDYQL
ncbi:hypothetical protein P171DRAFT_220515 [Karstenula rhodostoma CBS 690.94]|uniref:Uncharacterized protein n=1 Tax=Karstenula rhodostoma CBS 690.94 TaxID=1392251 RepID=A0A9P4PRH3_9PLEO|nr:hypothetical protein P171DRAFT_220515 [Karstenula rhodostoma CBS 690.94]